MPRWATFLIASSVIEVLETRKNVRESSEEIAAKTIEPGICSPSLAMLYMQESVAVDNVDDALSWKSLISVESGFNTAYIQWLIFLQFPLQSYQDSRSTTLGEALVKQSDLKPVASEGIVDVDGYVHVIKQGARL